MKRNSPDRLPTSGSENKDLNTDPLTRGDELWDVLGKASEQKADAFFARNVVRNVRQLADSKPSWNERLAGMLSVKKVVLPLAAAACIGIVAVTHFGPTQPVDLGPEPVAQNDPTEDPSTALAELLIEESLTAAAEDPSQFTHDELVAIVGL